MVWIHYFIWVLTNFVGLLNAFFDEEDIKRIGKDGIYGSGSSSMFHAMTDQNKNESQLSYYGSRDSPNYIDVDKYADHEVNNILKGKFDDPEPIYSIKHGYPYSDHKEQFKKPLSSSQLNLPSSLLSPARVQGEEKSDRNVENKNEGPISKYGYKRKKRTIGNRQAKLNNRRDNFNLLKMPFYELPRRLRKRSAPDSHEENQDYYGAISNTASQQYGRSAMEKVQQFKDIVKIPQFLDILVELLENLVEKRFFREAIMKLMGEMIGDISKAKDRVRVLEQKLNKENEDGPEDVESQETSSGDINGKKAISKPTDETKRDEPSKAKDEPGKAKSDTNSESKNETEPKVERAKNKQPKENPGQKDGSPAADKNSSKGRLRSVLEGLDPKPVNPDSKSNPNDQKPAERKPKKNSSGRNPEKDKKWRGDDKKGSKPDPKKSKFDSQGEDYSKNRNKGIGQKQE